jgi:hypothetical protein
MFAIMHSKMLYIGVLKGLQDSFQGRVDGDHWITMTTNARFQRFPSESTISNHVNTVEYT